MSADSSPIGALLEHASRGVSGELIGVSDGVEVHVYLQRGRLAWATDSVHPLAFTRRLVATAKVDVETFREVLDACRREKRPLGETLMAWEVATKDEIRGALRHQIDTALSLLHTSAPMQTIFLARPTQFADYDTELTFTVEELGLLAPRPSPSLAPIERPAASMPPDSGTLAAATAYLRGSIDGLAWVEEHTPSSLAASSDRAPRVPLALAERTLLDGAKLVAMRSGDGILAGVAMTPHRSLWCEVRGGTTIGLVVAGLASLVALGAQPSEGRRVEGAVTWTHGGDEAASAAFREFVERAPEVHAVLLTSAQEAEPLFGVGRASVPRDELFAVVSARAPALSAFEGAEVALEGSARVDGPPRQMMSAEPEFALFAGEISQGPTRRLVWLVLERDASKGLGWGYMTSLRRRLERAWSASGTFYPPASLRAELLPM